MNLREIAKIAGVSHSTVSRALRNNPHISKSTRERIQKLAIEHGYRPHPTVSKLMAQLPHIKKQARSTLALITCWKNWKDVHFLQQIFKGISERAEILGYSLEEFSLHQYEMSTQRLNGVLRTRNIEGAIILPFDRDHREIELDWEHLASVYIGRFLSHPAINRVSTSYYSNMFALLNQLKSLGYQRIALALTSEMRLRSEDAYIAAYAAYQREFPPDQRIPVLVTTSKPDPDSPEARYGTVRYASKFDPETSVRWLKEFQADALICNSSPTRNALSIGGLRVPEDLGYASLDCSENEPAISGIDQLPEKLGSAAVDMVTAHLHRNDFGIPQSPKILTLPGHWHEGETAVQQG